jgi:hypothetical protein
MRKNLRKFSFFLVFCLFLCFLCACRAFSVRATTAQLSKNEAVMLQATVRRLLESYRLASREAGVVGRYADLLRFWHQAASGSGQDADNGLRMLNFIRQIHFQNGGDRSLWKQVVRAAKTTGTDEAGMAVSPIPQNFK